MTLEISYPRGAGEQPFRDAPVVASPNDNFSLKPIGVKGASLTEGFWANWQEDNHRVTIPHALEWLERDGTVDNLRRLAPSANGHPARRGQWFSDSDLYKALEAVAWQFAVTNDETLEEILDEHARIILEAQQPDGYINSWVQAGMGKRWDDLVNSHELYCIGHLIQAGIAHRRAKPNSLLFEAAQRAADCVVRDFGDLARPEVDGHEVIEMALVELYRETGDRRYLKLAAQFIDQRGHRVLKPHPQFDAAYFQDATPIREQHDVVGHAVRALYLLGGAADVAVETGDAELLEAVSRQWKRMTDRKTYITGALGSRFDGESFGAAWELPPDLVYGETCASIGNLQASWRLLLRTGDARYASAIERVLFNLLSASTGHDRQSFFYSNPAHRRERLSPAPRTERPTRADAPGTRPVWFETACCPPNIMRTVASLGGYLSTYTPASVDVHQFISHDVAAPLPEGQVGLRVEASVPEEGNVRITIAFGNDREWAVRLRVPEWAESVTASVNGGNVSPESDSLGYISIRSVWQAEDVIEVDFGMSAQFMLTHPSVDASRGAVALQRGPVVYAFEDIDQPPGVDLDDVALDVSAEPAPVPLTVAGVTVTALQVAGLRRRSRLWAGRPWASTREVRQITDQWEAVTLTAIPYSAWANRGPSIMRVFVPFNEDV